MLSVTIVLSEYGGDHALSAKFALRMPSSFFVGLLRVKLELVAKRGIALGVSCALSKMLS